MKRKIICLIIAILCLAVLLPSCNDEVEETETTTAVVCNAHADVDANLFCDVCGTPVHTIIKDVPKDEEEIATIVSTIPEDATITSLYNCTFDDGNVVISPEISKDEHIWDADPEDIDHYGYVPGGMYLIQYTEDHTRQFDVTDMIEAGTFDAADAEYDVSTDRYYEERVVSKTDVVLLYNAAEGKYVFEESYNYAVNDSVEKQYAVYPVFEIGYDEYNQPWFDYAPIFKVVTTTYNYTEEFDEILNDYVDILTSTEYTADFYTFGGTEIVKDVELGAFDTVGYDLDVDTYSKDVVYLTVNGTVYAVENDKVIYSKEEEKFVARPMFYHIYEGEGKTYGYVFDAGSVLVYDIGGEKWIDCIYRYDIVGNIYNVFYLAGGKMLVQTETTLPNTSVNYDYTDGVDKYDVDYILVDVVGNKVEEVEFGYYIYDVEIADSDVYASAAKNVIYASNFADKNIVGGLALITNDKLEIIGEVNKVLPDSRIVDFTLIADNLFVAEVRYGEGSYVRKLYNEKGEELHTLPNAAQIRNGFIVANDTVYDLSMNVLYKCERTETVSEDIIAVLDNYVLIDREENANVATYYFSLETEKPVMIAGYVETMGIMPEEENGDGTEPLEGEPSEEEDLEVVIKTERKLILAISENYFIIERFVNDYIDDENDINDMALYNENNECVYRGEVAVKSVVEGDGIFTIILEDNTVYTTK